MWQSVTQFQWSTIIWDGLRPFLIVALLMPFLIRFFKARKAASLIRDLGPDHAQKVGTPTMGGLLIIAAVLINTLIQILLPGILFESTMILIAFVGYGIIGGIDDGIKLKRQATEGFTFIPKLIAQTIVALLFFAIWWVVSQGEASFFTIHLPLIGGITLWPIVYLGFIWFWLVGWSNATNLTDGLDGLLAGTALINYLAYALIALHVGLLGVFSVNIAIVGALIGFLLYNKPVAKIFMGDTGSLALGAGLAANAIVLRLEWTLLVIGLVYVLEVLSVVLQTISFHYFKRRIFPMSPIHHTFEKWGWNEWQIGVLFWGITLWLTTLTLVLMGATHAHWLFS